MASQNFKAAIARHVSRLTGHTESFVLGCIERPKLRTLAQFAIPVPKLIKTPPATGERMSENPIELCKVLAEKVRRNIKSQL